MTKEDGLTEEVLAVVASKYGGQEDCLVLTSRYFLKNFLKKEISPQQTQFSYFFKMLTLL